MHTTDATFIQAAMELSGNLLLAATMLVTFFGVLVVALSFRRVPARSSTPVRPPR